MLPKAMLRSSTLISAAAGSAAEAQDADASGWVKMKMMKDADRESCGLRWGVEGGISVCPFHTERLLLSYTH